MLIRKQRLKIIDAATQLDPKEAFKEVILQTIKEQKESKPKSKAKSKLINSKYEIDFAQAHTAGGFSEDCVKEKKERRFTKAQLAERKKLRGPSPGNGPSPGAAWGHNQQETIGKGKGKHGKSQSSAQQWKGKGKGKAAQKGSGKGAKSGSTTKGKSKGKGKGSNGKW